MAELSTGKDDNNNVSRTGSLKLFGKSPSRSFSKKSSSSSNPLKRIFSKKKSESFTILDDDAPNVVENVDKVVPKVIEETTQVVPKVIEKATEVVPKVIEEAVAVVPKLIQEAVQETKKVDHVPQSNEDTTDSKDSARDTTTEKKPESLVDKLKEEKEKIEAELHEKAKESGLEGVYKAITAPPQTVPSDDQPLDGKQIQERSVDVDEVKGENQAHEKEDNCVASLAQGLQQICAQWNTKKED